MKIKLANQDLIPMLIQQDMKHRQLVTGIHRAGFESDSHELRLMEIVAGLMGLPLNRIPEQWVETYMHYLEKATLYPIMGRGENLWELARECCGKLGE